MQERLAVEEARGIAEALRRELDVERETRARDKGELDAARETAANLQSVLEDFQTGACGLLAWYDRGAWAR